MTIDGQQISDPDAQRLAAFEQGAAISTGGTGTVSLALPGPPGALPAAFGGHNDTASLTASQRGVIGAYVRRCRTSNPGALNADKMQVMLVMTTDADGMVRIVHFAPADRARLDADPVFRRFAERARSAMFDPRCVNLPLPPDMLGTINVLAFRFSP